MKRIILVAGLVVLAFSALPGCGHKDDMVDTPLTKDAPPPPPRPNKPTLTPGAVGGGETGK